MNHFNIHINNIDEDNTYWHFIANAFIHPTNVLPYNIWCFTMEDNTLFRLLRLLPSDWDFFLNVGNHSVLTRKYFRLPTIVNLLQKLWWNFQWTAVPLQQHRYSISHSKKEYLTDYHKIFHKSNHCKRNSMGYQCQSNARMHTIFSFGICAQAVANLTPIYTIPLLSME